MEYICTISSIDTPLPCSTLRSLCGFHCGGSSRTIIREIDPVTKLCNMNATAIATSETTIAVTTEPNTKESIKPTSSKSKLYAGETQFQLKIKLPSNIAILDFIHKLRCYVMLCY